MWLISFYYRFAISIMRPRICIYVFLALWLAVIIYIYYSVLALQFDRRIYKECPRKRILTVQGLGGTGNLFFEYLSVFAIAKLHPDTFTGFVPQNVFKEMQDYFQPISLPSLSQLRSKCRYAQNSLRIPIDMDFGELLHTVNTSHSSLIIMDPYTARYSEIIQYGLPHIRNELRLKLDDISQLKHIVNAMGVIFPEYRNPVIVGVHYRGTDYIPFLEQNYNLTAANLSTTSYYIKAMNYYVNKYKEVVFIFISSDMIFVKENRHVFNNFSVLFNPNIHLNDSKFRDLLWLTNCDHNIINYGTFGAFCALYNGGETIAFDLNLPLDHRGPTVAMGIAEILHNWQLLGN